MNAEVTAANSHAVLAAEISDLRQEIRNLLVAGKQIAAAIPEAQRVILVGAMVKAELRLSK